MNYQVILAALPVDTVQEEIFSLEARIRGLGAHVTLQGIPPCSYQGFLYQCLAGSGPEWTGIYDEVEDVGYRVVPTMNSKEIPGKLIWDTVQEMGKAAYRADRIPPKPLPDFVYLEGQTLDDLGSLYDLAGEQVIKAVILPGFTLPSRWVNVNNFLENKGLLERETDGSIRWEETLAYHMGHGQVRINLIGREARGVVAPGQEYNQVRNALTRVLQEQLIDPKTGAFVVEKVWGKEELYSRKGNCFIHGPDLVLKFSPGYIPSAKSVQLGFDSDEVGGSEEAGIAIDSLSMLVWGNGIKQGFSGTHHVLDLVPTVLYLLGCPLPRTLAGHVMKDILTKFWDDHPVGYQTKGGLTQTEEALLIDRLEALGYIDPAE